jgi:hypothetical protein
MNNPLKLFQLLFGGIGFLILAGALFWFCNSRNFLAQAQHTPGVVVDLVESEGNDSTVYHPVVGFKTLDGEKHTFTSSVGSNPPSYEEGEQVEVLYLPGEPKSARINSFFSLWGGPLILGGIGSVFFAVGAVIWLVGRRNTQGEARLRKIGHVVEADYRRVEENTSLEVNGRNPWRIVCQWQNPETQKVHIFFSPNLWFDPTPYIDRQRLNVFIDPHRPKSYFVDTSFLPALAD